MSDNKEFKKMSVILLVIISIAIITLIGGAVVSGLSKNVRDRTTVDLGDLTIPAVNDSLDLGADYDFVQSVDSCYNSTNASQTGYFNSGVEFVVNEGDEDGGAITTTDAGVDDVGYDVNCSVTYLASNDAQTAADAFLIGIFIIASFIAVIMLTAIGSMIIKMVK